MSEAPGGVIQPTLVTKIQQSFGVTKKKIYTAQPACEPFIRDEQVGEAPNQVPRLPLVPVNSTCPIHVPTRDLQLAKHRSGRRAEKTSPHDLTPRRPVPYPRRSSLITLASSPIEVPENDLSNVPDIGTPLLASPYVTSPMTASPSSDPFYKAHPSTILSTSPTSVSVNYVVVRESPFQNAMDNTIPEQTLTSPGQQNPQYSDANFVFSPPAPHIPHSECAFSPQEYGLRSTLPLSPRLLAAASMDGSVPFIFSEEDELKAKAMLKAAGLKEIPLPQIAASLSALAGHSHAPPNLPFLNHPTWLSSGPSSVPSSSVSPTMPSSQGSLHYPHLSAPQMHQLLPDATTHSYEWHHTQNTV
jgi:hypothetical protein